MRAKALRGAPTDGSPVGSLQDVATRTGGRVRAGAPDLVLWGVATDTRAVLPGDLFCAIRGERVDAHRLLGAAFAAGARAALVDRPAGAGWSLGEVPAGCGVLEVPGVIPALGRLAFSHLRGLEHPPLVVGITGSVGKTGTRVWTAAALGGGGADVLTPHASFNTEVTVPLVCLGAARQPFVVLELAMRGPGQIAYLSRICRPTVGVLTVIGESHLAQLGSVEAIARAKGELLEALPADGAAVLNADDPRQEALVSRCPARVLWYGLGGRSEVRAEGLTVGPRGAYAFVAVLPTGRRLPVRLCQPGRHQVSNALAALAVAHLVGVDAEAAAEGLGRADPEEHRLVWREAGPVHVLDDAYNAAPHSVLAALATLIEAAPPGRRAAVLGDMLELGSATEAGHRRVGAAAAAAGLDWLVTVGPLAAIAAAEARARGLDPRRVHAAADRDEARHLVLDLLAGAPDGLVLLVKGSRALGLEEIVGAVLEWGRQAPCGN